MKNKFLIHVMFLLTLGVSIKAQVVDTRYDTIPGLVISEVRLNSYDYCYIELANVDDVPINLKDFKVATSSDYKEAARGYAMLPDITLQPGETFVLAGVHDLGDKNYNDNLGLGGDGIMPRTMPEILENVDLPVFRSEMSNSPVEDKISDATLRDILNVSTYERNLILEYHKGGDSVFVDLINATAEGDISTFTQHIGLDIYGQRDKMAIAGIPDVLGAISEGWGPEYTIVRKTTVKHGNVIWDNSRGNDAANSEWICIPAAKNDRLGRWEFAKYFTTIGSHGNGVIDAASVKSDVIAIDFTNHKMTVPWGVRKFNLADYIDFGANLSWQLIQSPVVADSSYTGIRTGDKLEIYSVGASRQKVVFNLELGAAIDATKALVLPRLTSSLDFSGSVKSWDNVYEVTYEGQYNTTAMDSVFGMGFAHRVDSLFKYLEKADGAEWEIVWVDGKERADLKMGDILRVSNGGATKDYYLKVSDVPIESANAFLKAIKWPDAPTEVRNMAGWNGKDVIPGFMSYVYNYVVKLPPTIKDVPALTVHPSDLNAKVTVEPAVSVLGLDDERTTTITVVSEDGTISTAYTVRFDVDKPSSFVQPVSAEPLFTRFLTNIAVYDHYVEISNPGTTPINLSKYMLVSSEPGTSPADIIRPNSNYGLAPRWYIFGYVYAPESEFSSKPMVVQPDYQVNPILGSGKSITLSVRVNGDFYWDWLNPSRKNRSSMNLNPYTDITFCHIAQFGAITSDPAFYLAENKVYYRAGSDWWGPVARAREKHIQSLYKIKNDSITRGLKPVGDPADFELIDLMGTYDGADWHPYDTIGKPIPGKSGWWPYLGRSTERKPEVWKPNPLPGIQGSWALTSEESEWIMNTEFNLRDRGIEWAQAVWQIGLGLGTHVFAPVTDNSSTILSKLYKVSDGYASPQTIKGVITGTSVADFKSNIIKKNPGQVLELVGKNASDPVVSGDVLKVTSADASNTTEYTLTVSNNGLSDNATLVAKDGSGLTVDVAGNSGTISGVTMGISMEQLLLQLIKPTNSTLKIFDDSKNLVPLQVTTADNNYMKVKASANMILEVTSENSMNKINYSLSFAGVGNDAAILFSNLYEIDQDRDLVSLIPLGTNVANMLSNLIANEGATIKLIDKVGTEREVGDVAVDDNILVTSPDGTVTRVYYLNFIGENFGADAYVTSKVLVVNQLDLTIAGVPVNTPASFFLSGLVIPATGAKLVLLDADNNEVTSGVVLGGYKLQVTSGDNVKTVVYSISVNVAVGNTGIDLVKVYPNPATDQIQIEGLRESCKVIVTSILGKTMKIVDSKSISNATISVRDLPAGIYFLQIDAENYKSLPVRFVKQ